MKTTHIVASILLLISFTACKKNSNEPKPEPKPIITDELVGYQIVVAFKSPAANVPPKLFHFAKSGNEVMATMDGVQSRRIRAITVTDNRFTFDSDEDGKFVYEFNLKRDEKGVVIMGSSKYQNLNDPSITMPIAVIWLSDFPGFKGKTFKSVDGTNYELKFTTDTWTFNPVAGKTGTFYEIAKGAWKGRLDGKDYMGFSAPDEHNQVAMGLTREDSEMIIPFQ
ncbi:hypothetical protein [Pedobacter heparinus]|uniref:hypothetical protein n=1 Tax=Pedobacter heparinus TaxID=984 RepID=UPI0029312524|nr:hypothetical protein [Pedobacter heparinus]